MTFLYFFIFAIGACFGSFTNVLVDRGQKGKSIQGFSECDFCKYKLKWFDNIPIFSFLFLKGKCRKCHKKLSWQYPIVELGMGLLFVFIGWQTGFFQEYLTSGKILETIFFWMIGFLFFAIFLWDLKYMIIPNELVLAGVLISLIYYLYLFLISGESILNVHSIFTSNLIGGIITFLFFFLMFHFSKGKWIGGGDVKLGFLIGFLVGWEKVYLMLMISYLLGGFLAVFLIVKGKKKMKSQIPFGPFLLIGCLMTIFWGADILDWYYNILIF